MARLLLVVAAHGAALAAFLGAPTDVAVLPTQAIEVSLIAPAAPAPAAEPASPPVVEPTPKPPTPTPPPEPVIKPQPKPVAKPRPTPVVPPPPRRVVMAPETAIAPPPPVVESAPKTTPGETAATNASTPAAKASDHSAAVRGTPAAVSRARFNAAYLNNPRPAYPRVSRRTREQGRVLLRVRVEANGAPSDVQLQKSSGFRRLDKAARDAVNRWRFEPAKRGKVAIASWIIVPIDFRLEGT